MEINNCKLKLKLLFEKFCEHGYEISNYDSDMLLKYLNHRDSEPLIDSQFFFDLINYALISIGNITKSVRLLLVNILQKLFKKERHFIRVSQAPVFMHVSNNLFLIKDDVHFIKMMSPQLQLSSIQLCSEVISHNAGLQWTVEKQVWEKLLRPHILYKSPKVENAVHNYISKLVWKLNEQGLEIILAHVLGYIATPIRNFIESPYFEHSILEIDATEGDKQVCAAIQPNLKVILAILQRVQYATRNLVVPMLTNYYFIEASLHILFQTVRDSDLINLVAETTFCLSFASSEIWALQQHTPIGIGPMVIILYCNVTDRLITKRLTKTTMLFSVSCITFWSKLNKNKIPSHFERHGRTFSVQIQFLMGILAPLTKYSAKSLDRVDPNTGCLGAFCHKLTGLLTEQILKFTYMFREVCQNDSKNNEIEAVKQLFKLTKYLDEFHAGVVYQTLFYILQCYVLTDEKGALTVGMSPVKCPDDIKLICLVLNLIKTLLKEHDIKWYDSLEIICLQNCLMNLVKQNLFPSKQLLQALDLIDLSIRKFLSPDLALLIESPRGNTLNEILVVTKTLIQHPDWEMRDSALHLLRSCTELAYIKYVPMQKMLQENELISLAAHAAIFDEEPYVQMTALQCLAMATKIGCLWNHVTSTHEDIYMKVINMLKDSHAELVRKEAAKVLTNIYEHQKLSSSFTDQLYNVMSLAAVKDLDWEVQVTALKFWELTIKNCFSHRGMIDGKFPSVTFCKERRKILTFDKRTIQQHLVKVMKDLASTGCLKVLKQCLNDDVHVMERAYNITKKLVAMLDYYRFESISESNVIIKPEDLHEADESMMEIYEKHVKYEAQLDQEEVIENILNTDLIYLIQNVYENYIEVKKEQVSQDTMTNNLDKWIDPNELIADYRKTDYSSIIEVKKNWDDKPKKLEGLLDEIIAFSKVKEEKI